MLHDYLACALPEHVARFPRESAKHWMNFTGARTLLQSQDQPRRITKTVQILNGSRTALLTMGLTHFAWRSISQSVQRLGYGLD
jgi:hypothetical protein